MPLRGRATGRNSPKFPNGFRSHIGSCSLEGPLLSRDRLVPGADFSFFPAFAVPAQSAPGIVS